jgi:hypothetical protein
MAWFLIFGELVDVQTKNIFGQSNSYVSDLQTWHLIKRSDFPRSRYWMIHNFKNLMAKKWPRLLCLANQHMPCGSL